VPQHSFQCFHASPTPGKGLRSPFWQCLGHQAHTPTHTHLGQVLTPGAQTILVPLAMLYACLSSTWLTGSWLLHWPRPSNLATDTSTRLISTLLIIILSLTGSSLPVPSKTEKLWELRQQSAPSTATRVSSRQKAPPWTRDILFESIAQSASDEYRGPNRDIRVTRSKQLPNHYPGLRPNPVYDQLSLPSFTGLEGQYGVRRKAEEEENFEDQGRNNAHSIGVNKQRNPSHPFGILFKSKDLLVEASSHSHMQKRSVGEPNANFSAQTSQFGSFRPSAIPLQLSQPRKYAQNDKDDPELTSDSDSSNFSLLSQCLSSENSNQLTEHNLKSSDASECVAAEICSKASNTRHRLTLAHSQFQSICWNSSEKICPPPVLEDSLVNRILSENTATCRDGVRKVLDKIMRTNREIENTIRVLTSGHGMSECNESNSTLNSTSNNTCQACKDWYKAWLCLNYWPVYLDNRLLPACPSQCSSVQTSCPFHTIFEDASMASGDPTFLCQDSAISSKPQSSMHQSCCFEVQLQKSNADQTDRSPEDVPAPREGEYVDLNTTRSCSSLLPLGLSTRLCDNARIELANRTLLVKRRVAMRSRSDSGWLDWMGLNSSSNLCPLQPVTSAALFIGTFSYKFYIL